MYFSELGQNQQLSIAELKSVYNIKIKEQVNNALIFESAQKPDIERLGGTPKIGKILYEFQNLQETKNAIIKDLKKYSKDKKIFFGISFYNKIDKKIQAKLGKEIKKEMQTVGYKLRWVVSKEPILSSVVIRTNKLLTRGAEYCLVFIDKKIILAKTIDVQDFSNYEFRDMRRPARDLVSGMTPPKLAKILINLATPTLNKHQTNSPHLISDVSPSSTLDKGEEKEVLNFLDPFCGSGTFLMEATLLGFENIYGSDISQKAIKDSQTNLAWLQTTKLLGSRNPIVEIKQCDVKNLDKCWNKKFDCVVTEPYLGPPIRHELKIKDAKKLQKDLNENYKTYLTGISSIMKKGGILVLISPIFFSEKKQLKLNLEIKQNGLEAVQESIIYHRPDQKIGREIYILEFIR